MRPCIKLAHRISNSDQHCPHPQKCVTFCAEGSEEVHLADEWDRTPAKPAKSLSYQDVLELQEIQRSLPTANQFPDPLSRNSQSQLLRGVPVELLPLLPNIHETRSSFSPSSPPSFPDVSPAPSISTPLALPRRLSPPPTPIYHPPSLAHLPTAVPPPRRPRASFTILPLLNTPPATPSPSQSPSVSNSPPLNPHVFDTAPYGDKNQEPPTIHPSDVSLHNIISSTSSPEQPHFQLPPPKYPSTSDLPADRIAPTQKPCNSQILLPTAGLFPACTTTTTTTPAIEAMTAKKPNQNFNSVIRGKFVRKQPHMGTTITLDERELESAFDISISSSTQALFPSPPPSPVRCSPLPITRSSPNLTQRME